ncbi:MAG: UDP-glucose/GDP-mannose dehydrogenase family protein [Patescibacteria group bacterium]
MTLTVIGTGFVGVVTAGVFASFGHTVYGLDVDEKKISKLQKGKVPFFEPKLDDLVKEQLKTKRLRFTTSYSDAISDSDVVFISVGTPSAPDGQADLKFVFAAAESLAPHLKEHAIVVIKSTVPPGTNGKVKQKIDALAKEKYYIASVPEFLREGSAVEDTFNPDRIVLGAKEQRVISTLSELHAPFHAPIISMSPESAQMTKYSANSFLATRITFINQIADLCEKNGADVMEVIKGIGGDDRIGSHYWYPGLGYGGSCFPKDVKELAAYSRSVGEANNLLNKISEFNEHRVYHLLDSYEQMIGGWDGKTVAVLGLSFKPNTDDTREAPSMKVIPHLLNKGATVNGFDPMVAAEQLPIEDKRYVQRATIEEAVKDADVIFILVEWPQITQFDFSKTRENKKQWLIDVRNQLAVHTVKDWGYEYRGVGR